MESGKFHPVEMESHGALCAEQEAGMGKERLFPRPPNPAVMAPASVFSPRIFDPDAFVFTCEVAN